MGRKTNLGSIDQTQKHRVPLRLWSRALLVRVRDSSRIRSREVEGVKKGLFQFSDDDFQQFTRLPLNALIDC